MVVHMVSSKEDFENQLAAADGKLIVVDFHASWCGPCKVIGPKFQVISESMSDVLFLKIDVDDHEDLAEEYNIEVMPTFVFLKSGKRLDSFSGANEGKLKSLINQHK